MRKKYKDFLKVVGFLIIVFAAVFAGLKVGGALSVTQRVGCTPPDTISYELKGDYLAGVCASEPPKEANGFAFYRYYANYFAFDESAPYEQGKNPFGITQEVYNSGSLVAESWTCGEYGACNNGVQSRVCTDAGNTGRMLHKPLTSQGCVSQEQPTTAAPVVSQPAQDTPVVIVQPGFVVLQPSSAEKNWVVLWLASLFILLLLLYAYLKWWK